MTRFSQATAHRIVSAAQGLWMASVASLVLAGLFGGLPWWLPGEFAWSILLLVGMGLEAFIEIRRDMAAKHSFRELAEHFADDPPPDEIADQPFCTNLRCDRNLSRLARKLADDAADQGRLTDGWFVHYQTLQHIGALERANRDDENSASPAQERSANK